MSDELRRLVDYLVAWPQTRAELLVLLALLPREGDATNPQRLLWSRVRARLLEMSPVPEREIVHRQADLRREIRVEYHQP